MGEQIRGHESAVTVPAPPDVISIGPSTRAPRLVSRRVRETSVAGESDGVSLVFAAA